MKRITLLLLAFLCLVPALRAQENNEDKPWSVNEATLFGVGGYNIKDTYLSPLKYSGWGMRILNERMKMTRLSDYRISRQQFINVDFAFTRNPAETASSFAGFVDYSLGYHYHFQPQPALKLLAGASVRVLGGFIYNTRNGNNPASAKVETDLNLSAMAIYKFQVNNYPFALRYQIEIPVAGVMFSPHYGQSYYEIFNLGNSEGVVLFSSLHNKFAMRNFLTADFPVGNFTIRAGYLNTFTKTDVNGIQSHVVSNSFLIGFVKEFIAFGGKRLKQTKRYNSAYY